MRERGRERERVTSFNYEYGREKTNPIEEV